MLGLTLEGGGAKGAYQIGAWKAFRELNMEFDGISGTSVGALNGAFMVQGDFDLAYDIWQNINLTNIVDIDDSVYELIKDYELTTSNVQVLFEEMKRVVKGFGVDPKPLRKLINMNVKEDVIRSSNKQFGFVTVCLTERKPMEIYKEDIPLGKLADYLMASSYLPIFKSRKLDGKTFLDGAFYNNLPIEMLYKKGCKRVVAVRLLGRGRIKKVDYGDLDITYIVPNKPLGGMMNFNSDRVKENIILGYFDTIKAMKGLKGKNYYLNSDIDEKMALKFFMGLHEESIKKLGDLLSLNQALPTNRLMLEGVIPKLITLLDMDRTSTYEEILINLIETMACLNDINSLKIYHLSELLSEIIKVWENVKNNEITFINDKHIINDIVLRLDKEKLTKEVVKIILNDKNGLILKP